MPTAARDESSWLPVHHDSYCCTLTLDRAAPETNKPLHLHNLLIALAPCGLGGLRLGVVPAGVCTAGDLVWGDMADLVGIGAAQSKLHYTCQIAPPRILLTAPQGGSPLLHSQAPPAVVGAPAFWLVSFCSCGAAWAPMCSRATSSPSVAGAGRRPGETPRSEQRRSSAAVECRCMRPVSSAGCALLAACPDPSAAVKLARRAMA